MLGIALVAAAVAYDTTLRHPDYRDFDQIGFAARALLAGQNPYEQIGPGRAFEWAGFYYPLTAAVAVLPLAWLPRALLNATFAFAGAALFGWVLTRRSLGGLLFFLSTSAIFTAMLVQWSWLFAASIALPWIGFLFAAKPTLGFAFWLARPSWWPVMGALALSGVAFAMQPSWVGDWLIALRTTTTVGGSDAAVPYLAPISAPGGFLVLLLLSRWRRAEARLVLALACIPLTPLLYETVPLFLVARRTAQMALLAALSWLAWAFTLAGPMDQTLSGYSYNTRVIVWCLYLPCVLLILARRNSGSAPRWVERLLGEMRLPPWIVGYPDDSVPEGPTGERAPAGSTARE